MSRLAKWILIGWLALLTIALGLALGFVIYTRVVIGVELDDQAAVLRLPSELLVTTHTTEDADITLQGNVDVAVPVQKRNFPVHLEGTYEAHLFLDTVVPLKMDIQYEDVIPVETELEIEADASMIYSWLPELPVRGTLPLKLDLPVSLTVPVDTQIRLRYDAPVTVALDQTVHPSIDETLHTSLTLDHDTSAPVTNHFEATVVPEKRRVPVVLNDSTLDLPLQNLTLYVD